MKKFLKIKVPILEIITTNSGTTTNLEPDKLIDSGGTPNFRSKISEGDIIIDQNDIIYTVLKVDDESTLSVNGGGVPLGVTYKIYASKTVPGANAFKIIPIFINNILRIETIEGPIVDFENEIKIHYNTCNTNANLIRLQHSMVRSDTNYMLDELLNAIELLCKIEEVSIIVDFTNPIAIISYS
jgi:hypothetical protein